MLQLVGGIEEDALFRLCDTIVDHDTAGALVQIEELAEQGQDIGRLVTELIEHLRQLLLVQHVGHVPESLPVTEETRERLREQANQLPEPTVLRLIDLLAIAVDDMRQGGDPRLPLELALVKITRPQADLSRDSLAHRLEVLEARPHGGPIAPAPSRPAAAEPRVAPPIAATTPAPIVTPEETTPPPASTPAPPVAAPDAASTLPPLELDQLRDAWQRDVVDAVRERSIPISTLVAEARPVEITRRRGHDRVRPGRRLPPGADRGPEEPRHAPRCAVRGHGTAADGRDRRRRAARADASRRTPASSPRKT